MTTLKDIISANKGIEIYRLTFASPVSPEDFVNDYLKIIFHAKLVKPIPSYIYSVYGFIIRRIESGDKKKDHIIFQAVTEPAYQPVPGDSINAVTFEPILAKTGVSMEDQFESYEAMWKQIQTSLENARDLCRFAAECAKSRNEAYGTVFIDREEN